MIHILFTGGTISMQRDAAAGGNVPAHSGETLMRLAPGVERIAPLRIEDWARMPACHFDQARLWALRERVRALSASGEVRGIVITHGTDILEETAYLLDRTLDRPDSGRDHRRHADLERRGMGRPPQPPGRRDGRGERVERGPGHDGGVRRAGVRRAHSREDSRHGSRRVLGAPRRSDRSSGGRRGEVLRRADPRRAPLEPASLHARVAHVPSVVGDQGTMLDLARGDHDGVVVEAFGSGNMPPGAVPAIRRWIEEGKPVVLASRCWWGQVTPVYAFEGGGARTTAMGAIPAGPRTPSQARMELAIALSAGVPYGSP